MYIKWVFRFSEIKFSRRENKSDSFSINYLWKVLTSTHSYNIPIFVTTFLTASSHPHFCRLQEYTALYIFNYSKISRNIKLNTTHQEYG